MLYYDESVRNEMSPTVRCEKFFLFPSFSSVSPFGYPVKWGGKPLKPSSELTASRRTLNRRVQSHMSLPYLRPYTRFFTRTVPLDIFECLNTVRLTGECNRKVPVKYTAVTVIRYGEQP